MFARLTESTHQAQNKPFGRHFQGGSLCLRYPGLKPWAMVYNRFAVKSRLWLSILVDGDEVIVREIRIPSFRSNEYPTFFR